MIWYLLYPIRGTTEAPVLPTTHPIRSAFARYGRYASQHVVTTLLVWSAVTVILLYPIPFLFTTDFINGASNLPHHVWTVAQPLPDDASTQPDIIMRPIWVHGDHMQALNPDLLSSALGLQDELLGATRDFNPRQHAGLLPRGEIGPDLSPAQRDAFHVSNGLTNQSWFFHSPLLYWGCSDDRILEDHDVISTVNDKKNQSTTVNVTLRHSIVFSGKRFEDRRLLAADALVLTLLHLRDSPVGRLWEEKAAELPAKLGDQWDIYPPDGRASTSHLYEFQFRPLSVQDIITLTAAYGITLIYFMASLSKLRAFNSKLGLTVTVIVQMMLSIMSSFTVCAILNIDLSRIPQYAYPIAVFAMSIESIFRLINAVIRTPPEDSTSSRIGYAYGETALTALASTIQSMLILLGLSRIVSASVEAFCYFAAIAILFNFFYLSIFFLPVLSVDVRRTELSDALAKTLSRQKRRTDKDKKSRPGWLRQFLQGNTALSTRVAGTLITVAFVTMAQWHFFADENILRSLAHLYKGREAVRTPEPGRISLLEDVHQASSPTSWLRLQDHDTAREVINIIKPSAYSYIARVYEPLVFVMKHADRVPRTKQPTLLPAAYDFARHELTRFVAVIVIAVSAVRLLCSYLLWGQGVVPEDERGQEPLLSVRSLAGGHSLDIVMLADSPDGQVVSVGLDRVTRVWDVRSGLPSYALPLSNPGGDDRPLRVLSIAIDADSKLLALLSPTSIVLWDLHEHRFEPAIPLNNGSQIPLAFFFHRVHRTSHSLLVVLKSNGTLLEASPHSLEVEERSWLHEPLLSAGKISYKDQGSGMTWTSIAATATTGLQLFSRHGDEWSTKTVNSKTLGGKRIHQVVGMTPKPLFLAAADDQVFLVNAISGDVLHTFETEKAHAGSLQCAYNFNRTTEPGAVGLLFLTLGFTSAETGDCVTVAYCSPDSNDAIGVLASGSSSDTQYCGWSEARKVCRRTAEPGSWELLPDGSVVGIRHHFAPETLQPRREDAAANGLRFRFSQTHMSRAAFGQWEMWTASSYGRNAAAGQQPLFEATATADHLLISELGPKVRVGLLSVAFAFGNVIEVVSLGGHERWEDERSETEHRSTINLTGRRRKAGSAGRYRSASKPELTT